MVYMMLRFFRSSNMGFSWGKSSEEHHLEDFPLPSGGFPEDQRVLRFFWRNKQIVYDVHRKVKEHKTMIISQLLRNCSWPHKLVYDPYISTCNWIGNPKKKRNVMWLKQCHLHHAPVISIFIGGMFTSPSHGWYEWHRFTHIIYTNPIKKSPFFCWLNPIKPSCFTVKSH